jgi:adenylosuccinate synthase
MVRFSRLKVSPPLVFCNSNRIPYRATSGAMTFQLSQKLCLNSLSTRYSAAINYYSVLNITKLDILDTFPNIKVAIGYTDSLTGEKLEFFPASLDILERVVVEYKEFKGWETVRLPWLHTNCRADNLQPITGKKSFDELPKECKEYLNFIREFVDVPVCTISYSTQTRQLQHFVTRAH